MIKDFKAAIISVLQEVKENTLEINEKIDHLSREIEKKKKKNQIENTVSDVKEWIISLAECRWERKESLNLKIKKITNHFPSSEDYHILCSTDLLVEFNF